MVWRGTPTTSSLEGGSAESGTRPAAAGDSHGEVRDAWHAKETLRMTYRIGDHEVALEALDELSRDLRDDTYSPELNRLGRTLRAWRAQITNWYRSVLSKNRVVHPVFRAGGLLDSAVMGLEEVLWHRGDIRRSSGGV
ncbi:transposase [Candidatus Poriferisodalis sp.]|uniref:transposase n=1 Tax=Candidatus Poriferisodalis sp. TaxID=3101277 RepID=UPI003B020224